MSKHQHGCRCSAKGLRLITAMLLFVSALSCHAQFYNGMNMDFGKNRVQWGVFSWSYYRTDNFDIYFYQGGDELARYAQRYADTQIPLLERKTGSHFKKKIQFILFNSLSDLKQSNIDSEEEAWNNIGGVTKISGTKAILYFDGDYVHFENQIRSAIASLLLRHLLNGTSIGSQIKSSYRYDVPEWFQNGLCAFIADDWDGYKENRLQNGIVSGDYRKINQLKGEDAGIAGCSFWNFIEQNHGARAVGDVLSLTENTQNVKKALRIVTGENYKQLTRQWYASVLQRYEHLPQQVPSEQMRLKYRKYRTFTQPAISPDGKRIAYVSNDEGKIGIWIEEMATGSRKRLYKNGFHSDKFIDTSYPLLAWHPRGDILSFIVEEEGKVLLCHLDIESGKVGKTYLFEFQKVTSFSYAHHERKIVLSASRRGKPDIYVYNLFSNTWEQITDDYHTDLTPVFSADDKHIIFSSNRENDSLTPTPQPITQGKQFDLFAYDYAAKRPVLQNLTRQKLSNNTQPTVFADGSLLYLNDSSGYYNLYEVRFDSAIHFIDTTVHYRYFTHTRPVTRFTSSILAYSYQPKEQRIAALLRHKSGERLYLVNRNESAAADNLPFNPFAQQRLQKMVEQQRQDSLAKTSPHRFKASYRSVPQKNPISEDDNILNVNPIQNSDSHHPAKDSLLRKHNYYVELFTNKLISQIDFTSLNCSYQPFTGGHAPIYLNKGLNVFLGTTLTDLMEDHRIDIGVKLNTSLVNNEYIIRYSDLSRRLDKSLTLHRFVTDNNNGSRGYYRTFSNEAFFSLSYPFSEILCVRGTMSYRNDERVRLAVDDQSLREKNRMENWIGFRGELVYDNTLRIETNLYTGARGKIFAEYHQMAASDTRNFIVCGFDYRHYTRIHRNFIWANRVAGSTSFGQRRLIYYMGGVDNWIFAQFDPRTPVDLSQNYAYQTLATNLRGFKQNIRNGNSFVVLNSELRFPIFSYFAQQPLNWDFVKNLQIVAFGDVGTAWTGWNPYDLNNSLYTTHYSDGNLNISVTEQKDPFVGGIGMGLRTTILGYFIRGDVAWGIEDRHVSKKPKYYLSFNLDF